MRELFADNHRFLMAEHHNTEHPHLHVVVKAVGENGKRLNPKKADLRHWRETFAENLRGQGIKAEATSRQIRGQFHKGMNAKISQMKRNGRQPESERDWENQIGEQVSAGKPYNHSKAVQKAKSTRAVVRAMYNGMIKDLERSEFDEDRVLASKLRVFLAEMPRINPREKVVYEEHREKLEQAKALQAQLAEQKQSRAEQQAATAQADEPQAVKQKTGHKPKI